MEAILVIGAIWFGFWLVGKLLGGIGNAFKSGPTEKIATTPQPQPFEVKAVRAQYEVEGAEFPVFRVEVKGPISAPHANYAIQFVVHLFDVTEGTQKAVFSALDWMQEEGTGILEYRTDVTAIPFEESLITDWAVKAQIPVEMITLPRSGSRNLEFRVEVVSGEPKTRYKEGRRFTGKVLTSATTRLKIAWVQVGYEEMAERRERIEELTLNLAMAVSAADGHMDQSEGAVIRGWLTRRVEAIEDELGQASEKRRLNGLVTTAYRLAADGALDTQAACRELTSIADPAARYDALELCLHVAAADGRAEDAELRTIRQLGQWMGINLERLRTMEQKILPVSIHVGKADDDTLLGLNDAMSENEVRKHLNREYRKWNSLAGHGDPQKREQAQEMLKRIAAARRRHVA